jgi:hypothetical protein
LIDWPNAVNRQFAANAGELERGLILTTSGRYISAKPKDD